MQKQRSTFTNQLRQLREGGSRWGLAAAAVIAAGLVTGCSNPAKPSDHVSDEVQASVAESREEPDGAATVMGSGSSSTISNLHGFKMLWGSTEESTKYSLVNYMQAQATAPPLAVAEKICATASIYSEGALKYRSGSICKSYNINIKGQTQSWYVYQPSASSRIRVRRGNNVLRIDFTWVCLGVFCDKVGVASVTSTIR